MKKIIIFSALFFFSLNIFAQLNSDQRIFMQNVRNKAAIGTAYPDFEFTGDDGIVYSKKKMLGKRYYINFWFTGCSPCIAEMPDLVALQNKLKNTKAGFISFTFDIAEARKKMRQTMGLNYPVIGVSNEECRKLNLGNGFPTHIVVDEAGNIIYVSLIGQGSDKEELKEITDLLLK